MPNDPTFAIELAPTFPAVERETLLALLRPRVEALQEVPVKGVDWQSIVVIIAAVETVAGGSKALLELATAVLEWRTRLRAQGTPPQARFKRHGQPDLELATATDQKVLEWLLQTPPEA